MRKALEGKPIDAIGCIGLATKPNVVLVPKVVVGTFAPVNNFCIIIVDVGRRWALVDDELVLAVRFYVLMKIYLMAQNDY